jgi:hypothetical protein
MFLTKTNETGLPLRQLVGTKSTGNSFRLRSWERSATEISAAARSAGQNPSRSTSW